MRLSAVIIPWNYTYKLTSVYYNTLETAVAISRTGTKYTRKPEVLGVFETERLRYCEKIMQKYFDEFPGFLGFRRNFGDISPNFRDALLFQSVQIFERKFAVLEISRRLFERFRSSRKYVANFRSVLQVDPRVFEESSNAMCVYKHTMFPVITSVSARKRLNR